MTIHVEPINDLHPHDDASTCHCKPRIEITNSGDMLIIHNSFDGRENGEDVMASTTDSELAKQFKVTEL